jgi:uncharacterized Zn ribbon protein
MASTNATATATAIENMNTECSICIEIMNKSTRKNVQCNHCDYSACRSCYKHYLLETNDNAHCISCKHEWSRNILVEKFDNNFVNVIYKQHRENVLLDRERSKMASTQPYVEQRIANKKNSLEIDRLEKVRREITRKIIEKKRQFNHGDEIEKRVFTKKCSNEDCKGYLSTQWKCGLCDHWSCPDCHVVIGLQRGVEKSGIDHVCVPDTLATAKLLDSDTKPCPDCATSIYKIDGCDMMFCTMCHTSFSWKTGKVETGIIHNPHYFEWLRNSGTQLDRNPLEVRCGREIDQHFIRIIDSKTRYSEILKVYFGKFIFCQTNLLHMRYVVLNDYIVPNRDNNLQLRVDYMMNIIDFNEFKRLLQRQEKQLNKKQEYFNIINMFITCQTDISYRIHEILINESKTSLITNHEVNFNPLFEESSMLLEYTNNCLLDISKIYKSTSYIIDDSFHFLIRR